MKQDAEELDAYLNLADGEVARLVLCLIIEERLRQRLAAYRPHQLAAKPVECQEKFIVIGGDVMDIRHPLG